MEKKEIKNIVRETLSQVKKEFENMYGLDCLDFQEWLLDNIEFLDGTKTVLNTNNSTDRIQNLLSKLRDNN